jgi:pimeloyl-ACP methyl ester carboxylesterase
MMIDGLTIRYARSDPRDDQALLLSPWPESIYCYAPTWDQLAEHAELVAVDLPGFGRSERRDDLLNPNSMGKFIVRIAEALGLKRPHAVGPDIGTNALLFAAAQSPGRFLSLVVGSGGASYPLQIEGVLKEWVEAPSLEPYRQINGSDIIDAVIQTFEKYKPSEAVRQDYRDSYAGTRFAESMRYVQSYPEQLQTLGQLLPKVAAPVQIINGSRDPVIPLGNAEYLHERLPASRLDIVDAGHFVWEDAADTYASLVTKWWAGGYRDVGPN